MLDHSQIRAVQGRQQAQMLMCGEKERLPARMPFLKMSATICGFSSSYPTKGSCSRYQARSRDRIARLQRNLRSPPQSVPVAFFSRPSSISSMA